MPVYTYTCGNCNTHFEAFDSIQKKESGWQPSCPKCGSTQTRQIYKPVAAIHGSRPISSRGGGRCSRRGG